MENENDTTAIENTADNKKDACCRGMMCQNKFRWAFFIIFLVITCAVVEYFLNKQNSDCNKFETMVVIENNKQLYLSQFTKLNEEIADLNKEVFEIKNEISLLSSSSKEKMCAYSEAKTKPNNRRHKWKTWLNLKEKIESTEPFEKELQSFNELFSYDHDLIALVQKLIIDTNMTYDCCDESCKIINACKKHIQKIIRAQKINYHKLLEISGYVLSSEEDTQ